MLIELGAVVVPIALPELFTSLKLGVVSASDGPFDQIYTFKLQEAQKNLAITGHLYATSLWLMNDAAYRKLSPKQREAFDQAAKEARSEEHTSELQHTVISYAVFCLKKKKIALENVRQKKNIKKEMKDENVNSTL